MKEEEQQARVKAIQEVSGNIENLSPEGQRAAIESVVPRPGQKTADTIWLILVSGFVFLILVSLVGLLYMIGDGNDNTSPDLVVTAFTTLTAGLLGLFVKGPNG
jgi:hypothetical protein